MVDWIGQYIICINLSCISNSTIGMYIVCRSVPLRSKTEHPSSSAELYIDLDELEAAFSEKTRLIILNSPHNPTGKVFNREEYQGVDTTNCKSSSDLTQTYLQYIWYKRLVIYEFCFKSHLPLVVIVSVKTYLYSHRCSDCSTSELCCR